MRLYRTSVSGKLIKSLLYKLLAIWDRKGRRKEEREREREGEGEGKEREKGREREG